MLEFFFFFKQKTAYEMRISDWSSDVCSSDLVGAQHAGVIQQGSADFAHTLIYVEEQDEKHQGYSQGHLGPDTQAEPHAKNWRQNHARHGIGGGYIGIEQGAGTARQTQPKAETQPYQRPDNQSQAVSGH